MRALVFSLLILVFHCAHSQSKPDLFVNVNGNLFVPIKSDNGMFPIIGYDKELTPKILLGGLGLGFSAWKVVSQKISIRAQANFSRSVYWQKYLFRNGPLLSDVTGEASVSTVDYTLGVTGVVHYNFFNVFSVGGGVGVQAMLFSNSYLRQDLLVGSDRNLGQNKYYKRLMPTFPVETALRFEKWAITMRYEHALLNRYKKDLAKHKKENYGLLFFEIGIKIN
jgi:hypothetical protein